MQHRSRSTEILRWACQKSRRPSLPVLPLSDLTLTCGLPPDPLRGAHDEVELAALVIDADQVAEGTGGEAALRTDRQVLQRHVGGRLADTAHQVVRVLKV